MSVLILPEVSEAEKVAAWREEELVRAGMSAATAQLCALAEVELHAALDLMAAGCPDELVYEILS